MADRADALRLPLGATIPIAGFALGIALLASATRANLLIAAGAAAAGGIVYVFRRPVAVAAPSPPNGRSVP